MPPPAEPDTLLDDQHPWPGLVSFTEADRVFFCGRHREIADLARLVAQEPLTVLFGKSGLGKSSLLRAGLAPVLREHEFVPIYIRLNHDERMPPLEEQVALRLAEALASGGIDGPAPVRGETLWEYFHKKGCDWWDADNRLVKPVLIFDQFEELLTAGQESPARAARTSAFLTGLEDLVENRVPASLQGRFEAERGLARNYDLDRTPFRVVLSLREDYLADLEGLRDRLRPIMRNRFRLLPMSGEQALDVVMIPGAHLVDEEVAIRIVDFVSASGREGEPVPRTRADVASRQVEPALLSVVLQELNNRRLAAGAGRIDGSLLGEGHATEILEAFYARGLAGLDEAVGDFVVDSLLTASGARNRIAEEDALTRPGITEAVIATLIDRRIVQRQQTGSTKWLELTHDTLAAVVRRDRTTRHQRRELAAAAARETDVRRALARTRRLVAAFAALLLVAALGFLYAQLQRRRAVAASGELAVTNSRLSDREQTLLATNQRLQARAEQDADAVVRQFEREIRERPPGAGTSVVTDLQRLEQDVQTFGDSTLLRRAQARAEALGAELLYARGYVQEGLAAANVALMIAKDLAAEPRTVAGSADDTTEIRASAEYAVGRGILATGRVTDAAARFRTALDLISGLPVPAAPAAQKQRLRLIVAANQGLGEASDAGGLFDDAVRALRKARAELDKAPSDPDVEFWKAHTLQLLGTTRENSGDSGEAVGYYRQARAIIDRSLPADPSKLRWQTLSAVVDYGEAFSIMDEGSYSAVARLLAGALQTAQAIANIDQTDLQNAFVLGQVQRGQGMLFLQRAGDRARAREAFEAVRTISDRIGQKEPAWISNRYQSAMAFFYLAATQSDDRQAASMQAQSRGVTDAIIRDAPDRATVLRSTAIVAYTLGNTEARQKHYDPALALFDRTRRLIAQLPPEIRRRPRFQNIAALAYEMAGLNVYVPTGRWNEARQAYEDSLRLYRDLLGRTPVGEYESSAGYVSELLGNAYLATGDETHAAGAYSDAMKVYDDALRRKADDLSLLQQKGEAALRIAVAWRMHGTFDRAVASLRAAAETGRKAFDLDPVQFNLYDLLERVAKEGQQLTDASRAPVAGAASPARAGIADAVAALLAPVNTTRLFWPRGASPNRDRTALEVAESQAWPLSPLVPGVWLDLRPMELAAEKTRLARDAKLGTFARDIRRIRTLPLPFYQDGFLYEAEVRRAGADGILDYVRVGDDELVIDGMSPPIHEFNKRHPLVLTDATDAAAYLRFFVAAIQGAEGTFRLLDGPGDLFAGSSALSAADKLGRLVVPLRVREESDGGWGATGTVRYGNNFFYAIFRLPTNGVVEMRNDTPVVASQPLAVERYAGGLRMISDYYIRKADIENTAGAAAAGGRWSDASQAQQSLVGLMRKKGFGDEAADTRVLVDELNTLSWYQLHAKRYEDALASSTEAHSLDGANLIVETNRAHALLLTGRADEALALYRAHAGDAVGGQPWNEAILKDLDSLEKAGVTSPAFVRVRQLVGR